MTDFSNSKRDQENHLRILEKPQIECHDVVSVLDDYVEQTMGETLSARLTAHLGSCAYCTDMEEGYRMTIAVAAELGKQPLPEGVGARLRMKLNQRLGLDLPTHTQ